MPPKLYANPLSSAVRAVLMCIKEIGLDVEIKPINLQTGEQLSPEYVKLNPQHTVPTLDDDGFVLWDSHAINAYLVGKYAKSDSLYPRDLQERAVVDQRLHFNSSYLFARTTIIVKPIVRGVTKTVPADKLEALHEAYDFLELFFGQNDYVAGPKMTIADFHILASLSTSEIFAPIRAEKHPKTAKWKDLMKKLPYYYEANQKGLDMFNGMIRSKLA